MHFEASIVGAKIKSADQPNKEDRMLFKSPEDYEHLSEVEKKELTKEMMAKHRGIKFPGGSLENG